MLELSLTIIAEDQDGFDALALHVVGHERRALIGVVEPQRLTRIPPLIEVDDLGGAIAVGIICERQSAALTKTAKCRAGFFVGVTQKGWSSAGACKEEDERQRESTD
jgi:hypothetical protein